MCFFNKFVTFSLRSCFVFPGSQAICYRAVKCLVNEMSLKTWPSNITVLSRFARISCTETSTRSKRELYALSTVVKTLYKGPIASSNFGCCLTKFEPAATTKLPALFSNIRSLINSSIFLVGWRLSGTGFSNRIINVRKFARDERELHEKMNNVWEC